MNIPGEPLIDIPLRYYIRILMLSKSPLDIAQTIDRDTAIAIRAVKGWQNLCKIEQGEEENTYRLYTIDGYKQAYAKEQSIKDYHNKKRQLALKFEEKLQIFCQALLNGGLPGPLVKHYQDQLKQSFLYKQREPLEKVQLFEVVKDIYEEYHSLVKPS